MSDMSTPRGQTLDRHHLIRTLSQVKAKSGQVEKEASGSDPTAQSTSPALDWVAPEDVDLSLLDDSLAKTPWERMQANDDALRFMDSLRLAMHKRNAKS